MPLASPCHEIGQSTTEKGAAAEGFMRAGTKPAGLAHADPLRASRSSGRTTAGGPLWCLASSCRRTRRRGPASLSSLRRSAVPEQTTQIRTCSFPAYGSYLGSRRQMLAVCARASRPSLHLLEQVPLDRLGDEFHGHLANAEVRKVSLYRQPPNQVLRQRQLYHSLTTLILHPHGKLGAVLGWLGLGLFGLFAARRWRSHARRPPQANAQPRTGDLQRTHGRADRLGNLLPAHAALDQVLDLLQPLGREFDRPSVGGREAVVGLSCSFPLCRSLLLGQRSDRLWRPVAIAVAFKRYGPPRNALRPGSATLSLCGFPEHDRGINFSNRRRIKTACKSLGLSVAKTMQASLSRKECGACDVAAKPTNHQRR